jgi:hypothetical protein
MSEVATGGPLFSVIAADAYDCGDGGTTGVSTKIFHLQSASFVGSITVKARRTGSAFTPVAVPYRKRYLNGSVGDDTFVSTAITGTSVIEVNCAGLEILLDCTSFTSGAMNVSFCQVEG